MINEDWVYDLEVFPNFFSAYFINLKTEEEQYFIIFNETNQFEELLNFITSRVRYLIGYNNIEYDDVIVLFLFKNQKRFPKLPIEYINKEIYEKSCEIINEEGGKKWWKSNTRFFNRVDLMKLLRFDDLKIGLKHCALKINHGLIQDLPLKYDRIIVEEDVEEIIKYNRNDVVITKKLAILKKEDILLRFAISDDYGIDVLSASDSKIANKIFEKYYVELSGIPIENLRQLRTERRFIELKTIISDKIVFTTNKFNKMLDELRSITIDMEKDEAERKANKKPKPLYTLFHGEKKLVIGKGGLHSADENVFYISDENIILRDADVISFYPNIVENEQIYPDHLSSMFCKVLRKITDDRQLAKKKDKKSVKAQTLKITANSVFGKMKEKNYWLYDPKALYKVTINGQLYLLMLIEALEEKGFRIFSANTDGIVVKVDRKREKEYYDICKLWQESTRFELEFTDYNKLYMRDVNCYVAETLDGKLKLKGDFEEYSDLNKALDKSIVRRAVVDRLISGIPIDITIKNHADILDFCLSQKMDSKFQVQYHSIKDGDYNVENLQKTNRFYISRSGGSIVKKSKETGELTSIVANHNVRILNVFDENVDIKDLDVNYEYYIKEAEKVVLPIINSRGMF